MFDCEYEALVSRLKHRAATSERTDDNDETIKKRLALFYEKTMPVVEYYGDKAIRVSNRPYTFSFHKNIWNYPSSQTFVATS